MAKRLPAIVLLLGAVGCSSSVPWTRGVPVDDERLRIVDAFVGVDRWEVAVCRVPDDVADPTYATSAERLAIGADEIVARLAGVSEYFERWSQGRHTIEWKAAPEVAIGSDEDSYDCVDRALDASTDDTHGVLVVADAQHTVAAPGGWGRRGEPCERPCPARTSRRAAYIGAADFASYWRGDSPLDLIEHEIGHSLGWTHSATSVTAVDDHVYDSDVDVMSDSAAPRRVDESRRHAPGVLAFDAWLAGWLDDEEVAHVDLDEIASGDWQDAVRLASTDSQPADERVRLVLIDTGSSLYTVELVAARGDNDHLRKSGAVIHEIVFDDDSPEGRRLVVQAIGNDGTLVLASGREWTSADGEVSIRIGEVDDETTTVVADLRIRRDDPVRERPSAGN